MVLKNTFLWKEYFKGKDAQFFLKKGTVQKDVFMSS